MASKILAAATVFLAASTLMTDPAQACISCNYTPEVVREHLTSRSAAKPRVAPRTLMVQRRAAKARVAQTQRQPAAKKIAVAKAAVPAKTQAEPQSQSITTGSVAKAEAPVPPTAANQPVAVAQAPAPAAKAVSETVPASTSTLLMSQTTRTAEAAPAKPVGCKKFLPAVGVTVDCK